MKRPLPSSGAAALESRPPHLGCGRRSRRQSCLRVVTCSPRMAAPKVTRPYPRQAGLQHTCKREAPSARASEARKQRRRRARLRTPGQVALSAPALVGRPHRRRRARWRHARRPVALSAQALAKGTYRRRKARLLCARRWATLSARASAERIRQPRRARPCSREQAVPSARASAVRMGCRRQAALPCIQGLGARSHICGTGFRSARAAAMTGRGWGQTGLARTRGPGGPSAVARTPRRRRARPCRARGLDSPSGRTTTSRRRRGERVNPR
mmetsp:Transcript_38297/g.106734  ORF Transcript_38297/g.106734 Transcript_38297/m.106734 type:complete len:270 (-) Transcript_38297:326-1135(-)